MFRLKHWVISSTSKLVRAQESDVGQVSVWYSWLDLGKLTPCSYYSAPVPMALKAPGRGTWEAAPTVCCIETVRVYYSPYSVLTQLI